VFEYPEAVLRERPKLSPESTDTFSSSTPLSANHHLKTLPMPAGVTRCLSCSATFVAALRLVRAFFEGVGKLIIASPIPHQKLWIALPICVSASRAFRQQRRAP